MESLNPENTNDLLEIAQFHFNHNTGVVETMCKALIPKLRGY
jgi:hypothetical protein